MGGGGWVDQVGLKLTQSPTGVGVGVGTELGNIINITDRQLPETFFCIWIDFYKVFNFFGIKYRSSLG